MKSFNFFCLIILLQIVSLHSKASNIPLEAFGSIPVRSIELSPDGEKIAYKGITEGYVFIASVNLKTKEKKIPYSYG